MDVGRGEGGSHWVRRQSALIAKRMEGRGTECCTLDVLLEMFDRRGERRG